MPLADRIRPKSLDEMVGQSHLIGKNGVLRRIIESGVIPNMIFCGPSGTGKTTLASIIAEQTGKTLYKLNGTTASTSDIKDVIADIGTFAAPNGILLYLDEIQYLNRKQQQTLLQFIENGDITLIASTADNPYFYVYNAILSRSTVFEFRPVEPSDVEAAVKRAFSIIEKERGEKISVSDEVISLIAQSCGGDVRKSVNAAELCALAAQRDENGDLYVDGETAKQVSQRSGMKYDRDGDMHYDILSAFQKSIRGSDENAALHYLARLIRADDLPSICRRLLVIAAEDIGLAYPQAISITKSCVDSALQLGFPEARIPLAEAVILLSTAPKSNSGVCAIDAALSDIDRGDYGDIPAHLKDTHYKGSEKLGHKGYVYPHSCPDHWYKQQYLPDPIREHVYYEYGDNKTEQAAKAYWDKIKK